VLSLQKLQEKTMESIPLHPAVVHFAIVLPIVALALELLYRFSKNETYSKLSLYTMGVAVAALAVAMVTGGQSGPEVYPYLIPDGQAELREHKQLGQILVGASALLFVIKLASLKWSKNLLELVFVAGLLVLVGANLKQGKDGGELTYEYGAGVMHDHTKCTQYFDCEDFEEDEDEDEDDD
jgi:uncharacterized membrane protein